MDDRAVDECRFQLQQLMVHDCKELIANQPWALEQDRWVELVFAILSEVSHLPEPVVRELAEDLAAFGLLSIPLLSRPPASPPGDADHRRLWQTMAKAGMPEEAARRAAQALHEVALGLQSRFDGFLQRYLRHYGEMMLDQLPTHFAFTAITESEAANAFTYWLQNAVLMPLSNIDEPVRAFCSDCGATPAELVLAADQLGANLSLVDDMALVRRRAADAAAMAEMLKARPPQPEAEHGR